LASLLGLPGDSEYSSPETDGIFELLSTLRPQGHQFSLRNVIKIKNGFRFTLDSKEKLRLVSEWESDPVTGVLRRRDTVTNHSKKTVVLLKALPRFTLARGTYKAYNQASGWGAESQGGWRDLGKGTSFEWGSERGRLCQPAAPYLCLAPKAGGEGLALHIASLGNWIIRVRTTDAPSWSKGPHAVIEAGLSDRNLAVELKPGTSLRLPELILQQVPDSRPHLAAGVLHKHLMARDLSGQVRRPPLVYNTWFDRYDDLDPKRLLAQARAAKDLGAEVFTVDAGWFGKAGISWDQLVGHWREKPDAAFRGKMLDFAEQIRGMGLGFGLWMEPERVARQAPIVKEHPEWLIESAPGAEYRIDVENPKARAWIKSEVSRVVKTYGLAWIKVDSNFPPGPDPRGKELSGYFESWWRLLDEWREEHPHTFFEGCSSGAMRLDLSALAHHQAHFLSDNVNPYVMLRILQGTALRLPPSRLTLWAVLRGDKKGGIVFPKVHSLGEPVRAELSYILGICVMGILTLSGDLLELPESTRAKLRQFLSFWKARREWICSSACHLLTEPAPIEDQKGWAAFELDAPGDAKRMLVVFRLDDAASSKRFHPVSLDPRKRYRIATDEGKQLGQKSGSVLMRQGLSMELPKRFSAQVIELN
jgi:alpha-galactosidase